MYLIKKVNLLNLIELNTVSSILYRCGKDMAQKYNLQHWNNSGLKNAVIVFLCVLKNKVYLVCDSNGKAVATFQTKQNGTQMRYCKLATDPAFAGKGIGSFCLEATENLAREANCEKVCCEVYDKSTHAINFYKNRGYNVCGNESTLKYTEIKMEKVL